MASFPDWAVLRRGIVGFDCHRYRRLFRLAFAIAHAPQLGRVERPHLLESHLGDTAFGYDPQTNVLRILVHHPRGCLYGWFSGIRVRAGMELKRRILAEAKPIAFKLSAERSADTGSYRIEQSELQRYIEATAVMRATAETVAMAQSAMPDTAALEAQISGLRQVAELLRQQVDDLREDRERWRLQAERLAVLPAPTKPEPEPNQVKRIWRWMRSTG